MDMKKSTMDDVLPVSLIEYDEAILPLKLSSLLCAKLL